MNTAGSYWPSAPCNSVSVSGFLWKKEKRLDFK